MRFETLIPCNSSKNCLRGPVPHFESPHASKFSFIVSNKGQPSGERMSSNPKVIVTNHFTLRFQFGAHRSVSLGRVCRQRHRGQEVDQFPQTLLRLSPVGAFRCTIKQLSEGYNRQNSLAWP